MQTRCAAPPLAAAAAPRAAAAPSTCQGGSECRHRIAGSGDRGLDGRALKAAEDAQERQAECSRLRMVAEQDMFAVNPRCGRHQRANAAVTQMRCARHTAMRAAVVRGGASVPPWPAQAPLPQTADRRQSLKLDATRQQGDFINYRITGEAVLKLPYRGGGGSKVCGRAQCRSAVVVCS